jgi:CheY-like chemotaxis protein
LIVINIAGISAVNKRILIVDDEEDVRSITQLGLQMAAGWEVLTAKSGSEGVQIAASQLPDAILLDMMMPDMDGRATFQHLQANPATRQIPVILVTAKAQAADGECFAGLEVAAIVCKPFRPLQLAAQITTALGWS